MTIRNLDHLLAGPESAALIGASVEDGSVSPITARNLLRGGFGGPVWLVGPKHRDIEGHPCHLSIGALLATPDLAVVAPPHAVPGISPPERPRDVPPPQMQRHRSVRVDSGQGRSAARWPMMRADGPAHWSEAMQAHQIMTRDIVTVGPDATVAEIAAILVRHRISAVPVVSGGQLLGIVSQTDLAHRSETGTEKRRKWWLEVFADPDSKAREYIKSHGLRAQDVMTRFVVSVSEDASLAEVADVLDAHRIRQVPVMSNGRLAGMISRTDLVRKLAETRITAAATRPDNGALQKAVWHEIKSQPWLKSAFVNLAIKDGVVELWGAVDSDEQHRALRILVEGVDGVERVEDHVSLLPKAVGA
jgi:CBS domain-containing protein